MVFNMGMTQDAQLIAQLGGPAKLAQLLGLDKRGGTQRVQNWIARGIPSKVRIDYPKIFKKSYFPKTPTQQAA